MRVKEQMVIDPFEVSLPILESERIRLRHPVPTDAASVLAIFGDDQAMRYWSHEPFETLERARKYLDGIDEGFRARTLFQWAIAEKNTDEMIGTVTLLGWDQQNRRAELGFMLGRSRWGNGLAFEAVTTVLRFAFDKMNLHRVEADTDPRNAASRKLLGRLGFVEEGHLRQRWFTFGEYSDTVICGLLASEFEPKAGTSCS